MTETILVTGATGNIGRSLVPILASHSDCTVRAMTSNPEQHSDTFASEVQLVAGRFEDDVSLAAATRGVDTVVLIAPPNPDCVEQNRAVLDAAKASGARKIVRISAIKASEDGKTENTRLHGQCDALVNASGLTYTILRPNYYMQNILMSLESIKADSCFYAGMGDGKLAMIDAHDVAESAAAGVMSDRFDNEILEISGPESINFSEVASVLSEVANRQIAYVAVSPDDVKTSLMQLGVTEWMANLLREYSEAYSEGWGDLVTNNVERLTRHPARSFKQYATDCLTQFLG